MGPQVWSGSQGTSQPAIPGCTEAQEGRDLPRCTVGEVLTQGRGPRVVPAHGEGGRRPSSLPPLQPPHLPTKPQLSFIPALLLYTFPGAAMTKDHKLSGLNNRNVLSHHSEGWKSEIEVSAGLVPSEGCEGRVCPRLLFLPCR